MRGPTLIKTLTTVGVATLLTSACLSSGSEDSGSDGAAASGEVSGSTVTIWASVDAPVLKAIQDQITPKAKEKGLTLKFERVDNINQLIMTKIQANDTPDIAWIPQPGVVADIVKRGKATPLDDVVDMAALKSSMIPGTLESGTIDGKLYGLLVSANAKSFVFYPKKAWDAKGYKAPTSLDELQTLTDKIKADGTTPWCMGIGSEAATGWPATDWFEDLIMRQSGVDGYNKWVKHEIKFDSPEVRKSAATFEKLLFTEGNVVGGRKSISSTPFGTAANPMFDSPAGCMMYKQGSFITSFFPEKIQTSLDTEVGVFAFPPATAGGDNPLLGGGDLAVLLKNTAGGQEAMRLLSDPSAGDLAAGPTNFLSPHKTFDVTKYKGTIAQEVAKIAYSTSTFLFDGSDQMPGAVGAGTFWKDMTSWISGQEDLDTALKNIDGSWPAS